MAIQPGVDLTIGILFEIGIAAGVFDSFGRFDTHVPRLVAYFIFANWVFVLNSYNILHALSNIFPGNLPLMTLFLIASTLVLGCLLLGYWGSRYLARFRS
jgi:hypothetical protein